MVLALSSLSLLNSTCPASISTQFRLVFLEQRWSIVDRTMLPYRSELLQTFYIAGGLNVELGLL